MAPVITMSEMPSQAANLSNHVVSGFVLALHHGNGLRNGTKARLRVRAGSERVLVHLSDERKQNLFFFFDMRKHLGPQLFEQRLYPLEFRGATAKFGSEFVGHCG